MPERIFTRRDWGEMALVMLVCLLIVVLFSACCTSRVVSEQLPPPPATVNTRTDSLLVTIPPPIVDVAYWILSPQARPDTVYLTRPVAVTRYLRPRPDSTLTFRLAGAEVDSAWVTLHGITQTLRYRLPHPGETLTLTPSDPDNLTAAVLGAPLPRVREVRLVEEAYPLGKKLRWFMGGLFVGFASFCWLRWGTRPR